MSEKKNTTKKPNKTSEKKVNRKPDIISITREAALTTYGVADIADKLAVFPVPAVINPLVKGKIKKEEAIFVVNYANKMFAVNIYLILSVSVKVSEALSEAQKAIKYNLDKAFPGKCKAVNVYAFDLL